MRFVIENINKVSKADISLKGLTVIAGENDSGKSTVGKLLFSTIKALANTKLNTDSQRQSLLKKYLSSLSGRVSKEMRSQDKGLDELRSNVFRLLLALELVPKKCLAQASVFLPEWEDTINCSENLPPRTKTLMLQDIRNIRSCLNGEDRESTLASEIQYFIESEFMNKICSLHTDGSRVEFYMDEADNAHLSYSISTDKIDDKDLKLSEGEFIQDATYVESPLYMHIVDALLYSSNYRETENRMLFRSMVPIHIKDFAAKLNAMEYLSKKKGMSPILENLTSIVGGYFAFDKKSHSLSFFREDSRYSPINIASGIKTFGVIQMLLEMDAINENKILIWDEPENHLHPQWQIEFANILVELAKAGIPVIISTHSPYFIQGVRYASVKHGMENFVNYYLTDIKEDGLSVLKDVSEDLNMIFLKLAEPLNRIMNIDSLRKR